MRRELDEGRKEERIEKIDQNRRRTTWRKVPNRRLSGRKLGGRAGRQDRYPRSRGNPGYRRGKVRDFTCKIACSNGVDQSRTRY